MQSQTLVEIEPVQVVHDRHESIIEVTEDIEELHDLFQQLENLATEQSPLIHHIENHTDQVITHLQDANQELVETIRKKEKENACKWYILLLLIFVMILVILIIKYT